MLRKCTNVLPDQKCLEVAGLSKKMKPLSLVFKVLCVYLFNLLSHNFTSQSALNLVIQKFLGVFYFFFHSLASGSQLIEYQQMKLCLPRSTEPPTTGGAEIPVLSRTPLPN